MALLDKYIQDSRSSIAQTLVPQLIPQCCHAPDDRYCCVRGFIVCEDHNRALCEKHYKEKVDPTLCRFNCHDFALLFHFARDACCVVLCCLLLVAILTLNQTNCPCNKLPPREKYTPAYKTQSSLFLLHYNLVEERDSHALVCCLMMQK